MTPDVEKPSGGTDGAADALVRDFPARIRACGERVGGLSSLTRRTGIARSTMENYATGRRQPDVRTLVAIAIAADVDVGWLATGQREQRGSSAVSRQVIATAWNIVEIGLKRQGGRMPAGDDMIDLLFMAFSAVEAMAGVVSDQPLQKAPDKAG